MLLTETFVSIEGEGKRAGLIAAFVRFYGCNCSCAYCDSRYAWETEREHATKVSPQNVVDLITDYGVEAVTITGGEPLLQPDINELLHQLCERGYWVNVETNGTIIPEYRHPRLFYTMDFKTLSSEMSDKMNWAALRSLTENDVLKFVVGNRADLLQAKEVLDELHTPAQVYFSPIFDKIEPSKIVSFLIANNLNCCHAQLQLHKYIWAANKRGV